MPVSRRRFFQAAAGVLLAPGANAQSKRNMIVRSARPEDLEMPLEGFNDWITPVEKFFVRSHHYVPQVEPASWKLRIEGEVATPLALAMDDLRQFPRAELVGVLECAGNGRGFQQPRVPGVQWQYGAAGNGRWSGVRLADVLNKAGVKETARDILLSGADAPLGTMPKFERTITLKKALDANTLLAFDMNGQPLAKEHGFPLRLVAPGWAGDSWVKWLTQIQVLDKPFEGFWMATAYRRPVHTVAPGTPVDPKQMEPVTALRVKSLIASPPDGFFLGLAPVRIRGAAWAGESPIASVEVSTDSGRTWNPASLGRDEAPFAWRLWEYRWTPEREGYYVLMSRARDAAASIQPFVADWNPSGYQLNAVQQVGMVISEKPPDISAMGRHINSRLAQPAPVRARGACLVCHDADIITQQHLTRAQWEKEIDKMVRWGAKIRTPADREQILQWLVQFGPECGP